MSTTHTSTTDEQTPKEFAEQSQLDSQGIVRELWEFVRHDKKWWIAPILLIVIIVGALVMLSTTGAAPLIYTIF